jgi:hypothetical protein
MVVKNGEYNSLWQLVGDLKSKEAKIISLPIRQRQSIQTPIIPAKSVYLKMDDASNPLNTIDQIRAQETKPIINNIQQSLSGDYHHTNLTMVEIEDHQKRHTFAPSLYQAQQNYRELRRLLKKINRPISKENKKQSTISTKRIS